MQVLGSELFNERGCAGHNQALNARYEGDGLSQAEVGQAVQGRVGELVIQTG